MNIKYFHCIFFVFLWVIPHSIFASDELIMHVQDVGAGQCVIVDCPQANNDAENDVLVLDCGTTKLPNNLNTNSVVQAVKPYLDSADNIHIIISHPDKDHYSLIDDIFVENTSKIRRVLIGGTNDVESVTEVLNDMGVNEENIISGDDLDGENLACGSAEGILVGANAGDSKNDQSIIFKIQYDDFLAIFPGDATAKTLQGTIIEPELESEIENATVLLVPHHGASTHGSPDWADVVDPELAIFSAVGKYGHPRCLTYDEYADNSNLIVQNDHGVTCYKRQNGQYVGVYKQIDVGLYSTNDSGNIIIRSDGQSGNTTVDEEFRS